MVSALDPGAIRPGLIHAENEFILIISCFTCTFQFIIALL